MDVIMRSIVVTLCVLVAGEPVSLSRSMSHHAGDPFDASARQVAREYSPYMYAAFPLHAPVPVSVLRVLSRAPAPPAPAASAHRALYLPLQQDADPQDGRRSPHSTRHNGKHARPYAPDEEYEASLSEYPRPTYYRKPHRAAAPLAAYDYGAEEYGPLQVQASALPQLATYAIAPYEAPAPAYAAQEAAGAATVLYARPSPSGGFTYRRVPDASAPPKKKASALKQKEKDPPFIVKIHKYRIVKDDLL